MQQIITAKLKLLATPEQRQSLRQTQLGYRDALNYVSRYAFEHGKTSSNERLQQGTYHEIRVLYGLPSQMACNVPHRSADPTTDPGPNSNKNLSTAGQSTPKSLTTGLTKPQSRTTRPFP